MPNESGAPGTPAGSPPGAPGTPSQTSSPAHESQATQEARRYATHEETQALSAAVGGLRNDFKALQKLIEGLKPSERAANEDRGTVREDLEKLKNEIRADREAAITETRNAVILQAISAHKITDEYAAEDLFDHVLTRHGQRIKVEGRNVFYENELGEKKTVKDFIGELLKTQRGQRFIPAPSTSGLPRSQTNGRSQPGGKRYSEMSLAERMKLSPAEEAKLASEEMRSGA
jgi:hypothetical protein